MRPMAMKCWSPMWTPPVLKYPLSIFAPPNAFVPNGSCGNQEVWAMEPTNSPRNESTTDQPIQFATLRTIGASRRQVLRSVLIEGLITAVIAAALGLFVGFGLAIGLDRLLSSIGISLPKSATVFATRTVVVSLVLGIAITLLASLRPALRATRVPPIAPVREEATAPPGRA